MSMRRSRLEWERLVAKQATSGLGIREFVRREGLKDSTFRWWKAELGKAASLSMLPVSMFEERTPTRTDDVIVVRVAEAEIELRGVRCVENAVAMLTALRATRC